MRGDPAAVHVRLGNSARHRTPEKASSSNPFHGSFTAPTGAPLQPWSGNINIGHNIIAENPPMVIRRLGLIKNAMDIKRLSLTGQGIPHMTSFLQ